jgi:prefoldin subunit 5
LFSDDEARKAIIDLRQRVDAQKATAEAIEKRLTDENNQLRRSLLDLQNQIETLRAEQARMRGQGRADVQRDR